MVKKLLNNVKWLLIANVYSALSKFVILILLAQLTTTREVGIYTLGLAITAPISLLFNMKMKSVIVTEEKLNINIYSKIRQIANLLALFLIGIITVIFYENYLASFLLIGIIKILDLNSEFYQSLHNRNKNFRRTSILIFSKTTVVTISFAIILYITRSLETALIVYIVSQLLHLLLERYYFIRYKQNTIVKDTVSYKLILSFMIPLGISQMLYSFGASIPKYFLDYFGTIEQVGIFSALLYFVTIVNLLLNSVLQSILPYIRELYFSNRNTFHRFIYFLLPLSAIIFGITLILPVILLGEVTLRVFYGEEYAEHHHILFMLIIVIILSIMSWTFDAALLVARKTRLQPLLTAISIILTSGMIIFATNYNPLLGASFLLIFYHFTNTFFKIIYYRLTYD